jgi:DNA-binding PadR family transcriptional regulator
VLAAFLRAPSRWRYGYDLIGDTALAAGTLYPILARLTSAGWLETKWDEPNENGRPPRHNYRLTAEGRAAAREMVLRAEASGRRFRAQP